VRSSSPEDDLFQVSDVDEDNDVTGEPETGPSCANPPSPPTVILPLQTSSQKNKTTSRRTVRRLSAGSLKQAEADDEDAACTDPPSSPLYGDGLLLPQQRGRKSRGAVKNLKGRKSLPASAFSNTASTEDSATASTEDSEAASTEDLAAAFTEETAGVQLAAGSGRAKEVATASLKKKRGRPAKAKTEPIEGIQDKKKSGTGNFLSLLSARVILCSKQRC
jgi:hypothetical protein